MRCVVNAHGSWDASRDSDQLREEIDDLLIDINMTHVNSGIPTPVRQLGPAMVKTALDITIAHRSDLWRVAILVIGSQGMFNLSLAPKG